MEAIILGDKNYYQLLSSLGKILSEARLRAASQINQVLVSAYWELGKRIVHYEPEGKRRARYGTHLLETLSRDLTHQFGQGFSRDNLEKMRKFYLLFPNSATLSRKLSWSNVMRFFVLKYPKSQSVSDQLSWGYCHSK